MVAMHAIGDKASRRKAGGMNARRRRSASCPGAHRRARRTLASAWRQRDAVNQGRSGGVHRSGGIQPVGVHAPVRVQVREIMNSITNVSPEKTLQARKREGARFFFFFFFFFSERSEETMRERIADLAPTKSRAMSTRGRRRASSARLRRKVRNNAN